MCTVQETFVTLSLKHFVVIFDRVRDVIYVISGRFGEIIIVDRSALFEKNKKAKSFRFSVVRTVQL